MTQAATYVELCTRLSRFVQLQPSTELTKELHQVMEDLLKLYERLELSLRPEKAAIDTPLVGLAAMDDLVLYSLHRLLGSFVRSSRSLVLQELSFGVFIRVLRRCKPRMVRGSSGQVQRHLGFVQSCVLYLPPPPEATADTDEKSPDAVTLAAQPEELRLAILQSLWELLKEPEPEKQAMQLRVDEQHFLAYLVASLLHVAQRDRCREAALRSIEVLKCVFLFVRDSHTLRQYLPGVAAGLWKSANAPQQASNVIVAALQCFSLALGLCISDRLLPEEERPKQQQRFTLEGIRQSISTNAMEREDTAASVEERSPDDDKWMETTAINMDVLLSRMFAASASATAFTTHGTKTGLPRSSWRVRCALAQLCGTVMLQCRRGLRMSFFRCYDELLVLRGDAIPEVSREAEKVLQALQTSSLSSEERLQVLPEMADRFQMLLSTLVLKVATEHEATKMHFVRTLRGYVEFLGSSLTPYLDASVESIYTSLCRVLSFAALDIELVSHHSLPSSTKVNESYNSSAARVVVAQFQKRLRFFREEASVCEALAMVSEIGAVLTPAGFIDCAFTLLSDANVMSTEAGGEVVLVLNEFLRAYCPDKNSKVHLNHHVIDVHLIGRILEDLLMLKAWEEHSPLPPNSASCKALVSQRAFMVECVGVCAEILGTEFKVFLLHVLYPLVEQLGSHSVEVERAALVALEKVYFFTGYESLEALFQANMDYFVDALCARLEQLDAYPMTAFVVDALIKHTRLASLPLVDEVTTSLLRSVDLYQDSSHVGGLLCALKNLLGSIARDAQEMEGGRVQTLGDGELGKPATARSLLSDFVHEMKVLENDGIEIKSEGGNEEKQPDLEETDRESVKAAMPLEHDDIRSDNQDGDLDDDDDEEKPAGSGYRTLVIDIIDRCGYFLVESDPIACCLVLSLIDEGVRFLSRYRKQLLPLVARMWPELLPRLRVQNRTIVTGTVRVITTVAAVAGDFVGDRFVESVWPILRSQLQSICFDSDAKSPQLTRSMLLLLQPPMDASRGVDAQLSGPRTDTETPQDDELSSVHGVRKTHEVHQLLAILSCLTMACQQSETMTQLVPEITRSCCKYLSSAAPREVVEQTSELFAALAQLNGDEVFCSVAALAHWLPPPPPSASFPTYEADVVEHFYAKRLSGLSGQTKTCRGNARVLMDRLFR